VVPDKRSISSDARKRLEAIASMDELGAGFTLATHDLEIRGAGELLGEDQSGQMAEVGFSLYTELLERAVRSIKRGELPDLDGTAHHGAEVELHLPALIPDDYLPDVHARLTLYKRISSARDADGLRELQVEMIDRFGLLPDPARHLFAVAALKHDATALGIRKLDLGPAGGRVQFESKPRVDPMTVIQLIQRRTRRSRRWWPGRRATWPRRCSGTVRCGSAPTYGRYRPPAASRRPDCRSSPCRWSGPPWSRSIT
jgi:transcription-repair coupling factor (superfamily II helicase)